jgi:hypothetical protein
MLNFVNKKREGGRAALDGRHGSPAGPYSGPSGNWILLWRALWGLVDRNSLVAKRSSAKRIAR